MKLTRDELGLERHAIDSDKLIGVLGPLGQLDITDALLLLGLAHVVAVLVEEHLGQVEELGYELLHVRCVALAVLP